MSRLDRESTVGKSPNEAPPVEDRPPHDKIVRGALETIASDKISGTRMREIAKRSGLSQGHLHYYFPAKASLFQAVLDHLSETFVAERTRALHDTSLASRDKLNVFLQQEVDLVRQCADLLLVRLDFLVQGTRDPAIEAKVREMYATWRSDIAEVVAEGVASGAFSSEFAPLIPNLLIALMEGAFLQYINEPDSNNLESFFSAAHEMVVRLLSTAN